MLWRRFVLDVLFIITQTPAIITVNVCNSFQINSKLQNVLKLTQLDYVSMTTMVGTRRGMGGGGGHIWGVISEGKLKTIIFLLVKGLDVITRGVAYRLGRPHEREFTV